VILSVPGVFKANSSTFLRTISVDSFFQVTLFGFASDAMGLTLLSLTFFSSYLRRLLAIAVIYSSSLLSLCPWRALVSAFKAGFLQFTNLYRSASDFTSLAAWFQNWDLAFLTFPRSFLLAFLCAVMSLGFVLWTLLTSLVRSLFHQGFFLTIALNHSVCTCIWSSSSFFHSQRVPPPCFHDFLQRTVLTFFFRANLGFILFSSDSDSSPSLLSFLSVFIHAYRTRWSDPECISLTPASACSLLLNAKSSVLAPLVGISGSFSNWISSVQSSSLGPASPSLFHSKARLKSPIIMTFLVLGMLRTASAVAPCTFSLTGMYTLYTSIPSTVTPVTSRTVFVIPLAFRPFLTYVSACGGSFT